MKTLVTHINPHLDDISAIWLFRKFHPEFKEAKVEFLSQSQTENIKGSETKDRVFFGIGKGRFDEHKGDLEDCATSLVWKEIKLKKLAPSDEFETRAYTEFIKYSFLVDTAKLPAGDYDSYRLDSFIRSYEDSPKDSLATVELGSKILDRIIPKLIRKQHGLTEWEKRFEFKSKWGKSVAVLGADFSRSYAYSLGFNVVIQLSPKDHFIGITAPGTSDVDLSPVYKKLMEIEPKMGWYLHHSHHMILCGAKSAPDAKRSKLTLKEVIDIIKGI